MQIHASPRTEASARSWRPSRSSSVLQLSGSRDQPTRQHHTQAPSVRTGPAPVRERAGFEVRDVHNSHYGRMCPSRAPGARTSPYRPLANPSAVINPRLHRDSRTVASSTARTDDIDYLTADEEENHTIAQANEFIPDSASSAPSTRTAPREGSPACSAVLAIADGVFGGACEAARAGHRLYDVSPRQMTSVATSLIPGSSSTTTQTAPHGLEQSVRAVPLFRRSTLRL